MSDLKRFGKRIDKLSNEMIIKIEKVQRAVALVVVSDLILNTPVDEGRARSNWQASLGKPEKGKVDAFNEGKKLGIGEISNATAAIDEANRIIAGHLPSQDIYITNNLKYIGLLNDGSSEQQPALFVERAIKVGESINVGIGL